MKSPFSGLAESVLKSTTAPSGRSTLPDWLVAPLAVLAGQDTTVTKEAGWADENVVRKAIALYRAASARGGGQAAASWQFSPNGRQAVQVLPPATDGLQEQMFMELSRRLESVTMNHPRLAPILEAAVQQGYPYLAARVGEGFEALTRRVGLPLEPAKALRVAEQVVSALEYAHYRNVIHGSFDLQDILLNEQGQASLLGVGVEQLRQRLGVTGVMLASPLLPPEVESGAQPADKRTDVFAMGALFYVLLTGRVPAAGQQIQLSQSIPGVPAALDAVMTKALAENPDERYPSLVEMNRDLSVALRAPRAVARPSTPAQRSLGPAPARTHQPSATSSRGGAPAIPAPARAPGVLPDGFPEQLPMPAIDFSALEQALVMPEVAALVAIEIPPAPEIPRIDWAEMLQPVDLSAFAGSSGALTYPAIETLAPDPLVAAAMAVKATERSQQNRQRQTRQPADIPARTASVPASAEAAPQVKPPPASTKPPAKPRRIRRRG